MWICFSCSINHILHARQVPQDVCTQQNVRIKKKRLFKPLEVVCVCSGDPSCYETLTSSSSAGGAPQEHRSRWYCAFLFNQAESLCQLCPLCWTTGWSGQRRWSRWWHPSQVTYATWCCCVTAQRNQSSSASWRRQLRLWPERHRTWQQWPPGTYSVEFTETKKWNVRGCLYKNIKVTFQHVTFKLAETDVCDILLPGK